MYVICECRTHVSILSDVLNAECTVVLCVLQYHNYVLYIGCAVYVVLYVELFHVVLYVVLYSMLYIVSCTVRCVVCRTLCSTLCCT